MADTDPYEEFEYFKRDYDLAKSFIASAEIVDGTVIPKDRMPLYPDGGIIRIYGHRIPMDELDAHDQSVVRRIEKRGCIFARCWSTKEPSWGDIGSHPITELTPITKDEFEAARDRLWKP